MNDLKNQIITIDELFEKFLLFQDIIKLLDFPEQYVLFIEKFYPFEWLISSDKTNDSNFIDNYILMGYFLTEEDEILEILENFIHPRFYASQEISVENVIEN